MPLKRAPNKVLVGAHVNVALSDAVDAWVFKNPGRTRTDFLILALVEKLEGEGIPVDRREMMARHHYRPGRKPAPVAPVETLAGDAPVRRETVGFSEASGEILTGTVPAGGGTDENVSGGAGSPLPVSQETVLRLAEAIRSMGPEIDLEKLAGLLPNQYPGAVEDLRAALAAAAPEPGPLPGPPPGSADYRRKPGVGRPARRRPALAGGPKL